ncbi:sensor histidine kinase [Nocardioides sp. Root190]|uniref:HAMP domain-containing sensor histidine kinase n=1 Tax=Nocardioides sp. Root190 TaxID=1736488 RepID=UPI000A446452|nr:HAMP domain-containing sensor histidine kinase [Nocardioides sp. Root190]
MIPNWSIGTRLLLAQALVLVAAIATAGAIAALVGPSLFHAHLLQAEHDATPSEVHHVEEAYQTASVLSLGVAMASATLIALLVSWYLTRRFQAPLTALTQAASAVSDGQYEARVPVGGAGPEMDSLATAFNTMAFQLAQTEDTRRRLLSDLAHELRTPVATLSAYLEGLEDGITPWTEGTRTVLVDQVERLSRLANDIDSVSRAEEGRIHLELASEPLEDLVKGAVRSHLDAYAIKGVQLVAEPGSNTVITIDRPRMLQVLTNLLDNALRHTPPGGAVMIRRRQAADGAVEVSVADTGDGIPEGQLPHLFERFYRGDTARDREHQGSGIGLTVSQAIVEAHGGRLTAHSAGEGRGAVFTIRFTRAAQ